MPAPPDEFEDAGCEWVVRVFAVWPFDCDPDSDAELLSRHPGELLLFLFRDRVVEERVFEVLLSPRDDDRCEFASVLSCDRRFVVRFLVESDVDWLLDERVVLFVVEVVSRDCVDFCDDCVELDEEREGDFEASVSFSSSITFVYD